MGYNFFLYGAYDEGQTCFGRFKNFIKSSQSAYVKGTIVKLSCGLPLLINEGSYLIPGRLIDLDIKDSYWPIFDALNGYNEAFAKKSFILRERVQVEAPESAPVFVDAYCLNPEKRKHGFIQLSEQECLMLNHQKAEIFDLLTERQKTYIQKLSSAKGREIVPVDLSLYRELMSLELIVDKGRRLALTNLGQEVSFFL